MANYSKKTSSGSSKTLMSGKAPISPLINNMSSRAPRNTILSPLGENSNLRREAFNRKQFDDTINTNFTELGVNTVDPSTFDPSLATVGDFFTQQEEIDALLAEIDELRAQNVKLVADMTNTITNLEEAFVAAQANNNAG